MLKIVNADLKAKAWTFEAEAKGSKIKAWLDLRGQGQRFQGQAWTFEVKARTFKVKAWTFEAKAWTFEAKARTFKAKAKGSKAKPGPSRPRPGPSRPRLKVPRPRPQNLASMPRRGLKDWFVQNIHCYVHMIMVSQKQTLHINMV